jgi:hypothetical protein
VNSTWTITTTTTTCVRFDEHQSSRRAIRGAILTFFFTELTYSYVNRTWTTTTTTATCVILNEWQSSRRAMGAAAALANPPKASSRGSTSESSTTCVATCLELFVSGTYIYLYVYALYKWLQLECTYEWHQGSRDVASSWAPDTLFVQNGKQDNSRRWWHNEPGSGNKRVSRRRSSWVSGVFAFFSLFNVVLTSIFLSIYTSLGCHYVTHHITATSGRHWPPPATSRPSSRMADGRTGYTDSELPA